MAEAASDLSGRSALGDLFLIRHIEGFPSINGYRLGRAPDDKRQLHWNEINAAWGEVSIDNTYIIQIKVTTLSIIVRAMISIDSQSGYFDLE